MRTVLQRVLAASVTVDGVVRASINHGLLALVGLEATDTDAQLTWMAEKVPNLRIFEDDQGKMNRGVLDVGGSILLVPNFTLAGDCAKADGRRSTARCVPNSPNRCSRSLSRWCRSHSPTPQHHKAIHSSPESSPASSGPT